MTLPHSQSRTGVSPQASHVIPGFQDKEPRQSQDRQNSSTDLQHFIKAHHMSRDDIPACGDLGPGLSQLRPRGAARGLDVEWRKGPIDS